MSGVRPPQVPRQQPPFELAGGSATGAVNFGPARAVLVPLAMARRQKVLVAMSGGVDSSSPRDPPREGYEVVGCFMRRIAG